ncbi:MAG: M28 family metallopeptidase [Anaerolineae bacterium]
MPKNRKALASPMDARRRLWRVVLTTLLVLLWLMLWRAPTRGALPTMPETLMPPATPEAPFGQVTYTPIVAVAMRGITPSALYATVGDLSGAWPIHVEGETVTLTTRYSYADPMIGAAEAYARQRFLYAGLTASCEPYTLGTTERCNIVAEQRGILEPERIVVLGAHLDSISTNSDPAQVAPGADDNASGVAAVFAAAVALTRYDLPFTLRYVLFTGEEQGLDGSAAYAEAMVTAGEEIIAMLNLDMIGYNSGAKPEPIMQLHTRSGDVGISDRAIARVFTEVVATYNLALVPEIIVGGTSASDHASF